MSLLSVRKLVVEYVTEGYSVRALDGLEFDADAGELVVLLGPSGSGKTSLLSCLAGILTPTSGVIEFDGEDITGLDAAALAAYRRSRVGIVFQASNLIQSLTARENVATPLLIAGASRAQAGKRADTLLDLVHLSDRAHHRPAKMSGGQQQRVALARGLAHDPPMLLADEPTANLDYINAESIISLLRDLRSDGRLIIVSTHDDRMVRVADRVVEMVQDFHPAGTRAQHVQYAAGETIFEQGSKGQLVYQIDAGKVDVVRVETKRETPLAVLGPGQYFGELGPLLGFPRSATVRAKTDVTLTAFGVREFRERITAAGASGDAAGAAAPKAARGRTRPARKAAAKKTAARKAPATAKPVAKRGPAKKRASRG